MRWNKKMLAVTAILAVGILAGCGGAASSTSTASSVASSVPAASSEAASSEAAAETDGVKPIETEETIDALQHGDSSYKVSADITNVSDDSVTLTVYSYDAYNEEDIKGLQVGDVIFAHDQQTAKLEAVTIEKLEKDEYDNYTINGGIEEGGIDLWNFRGVYRTDSMDDYPVYYKVGEVTLPLAEDVTLEDSSADPQASVQQSTGVADVARDIADSDDWTVYNTTVFVQDGHVFDIQRVWVP